MQGGAFGDDPHGKAADGYYLAVVCKLNTEDAAEGFGGCYSEVLPEVNEGLRGVGGQSGCRCGTDDQKQCKPPPRMQGGSIYRIFVNVTSSSSSSRIPPYRLR